MVVAEHPTESLTPDNVAIAAQICGALVEYAAHYNGEINHQVSATNSSRRVLETSPAGVP